MRLCVVVVAGALIVAATVVAIGPRLWNATNPQSEYPVELPPWEGIAERTYVYDIAGNEIAAYE